ncbi:hypothetical protein C8J57DRAFT_1723041 [Mycena rebaudengoi]|nr:hypothetical protein C8J57DRAFT_1723041 [Mycena rebaudengoi]
MAKERYTFLFYILPLSLTLTTASVSIGQVVRRQGFEAGRLRLEMHLLHEIEQLWLTETKTMGAEARGKEEGLHGYSFTDSSSTSPIPRSRFSSLSFFPFALSSAG